MSSLFRFSGEEKLYNKSRGDNIDEYWDSDYDLKDSAGWDQRYEHESKIISYIINTYGSKKILELGSGPGNLCTKIVSSNEELSYHLVDGESASRAHVRRQNKGKFFVKDLLDSFDTSALDTNYDLVIANDFFEHIRNPALIVSTVREKLTTKDSYFFVSSPNWRMKHEFYYPGLFDYDNLIKFFYQERYKAILQFPSWSQNVMIPKGRLGSESTIPEQHLMDWNYYILFKKEV